MLIKSIILHVSIGYCILLWKKFTIISSVKNRYGISIQIFIWAVMFTLLFDFKRLELSQLLIFHEMLMTQGR